MQQISKCTNCNSLVGSFLKDCTKDSAEHIEKQKIVQTTLKGDAIFNEGDKIKGIYCFCSGKVKVIKKNRNQKEFIISLPKTGDLLGVHSTIQGAKYSNSAIALEDTVCCFVPKVSFLRVIKTNPDAFLKVMQLLCIDIEKVEKRITEFSKKSISKRLAHGLLLLKDTYGTDKNNNINVSLQSVQLPSLIIASESETNNTLQQFIDKDLINIKHKKLKLNDVESIKDIAEHI